MRTSKKKLVGISALSLIALASLCSKPVSAQEVYVQGGTQGGGLGAALPLTSWLGLHADLDAFNFSHSFHAGGNKFDGDLHVRHLGVYADVFPFASSGFRLTAGALFNRDRLTGIAEPDNGSYKINGISVPASLVQGQAPEVEARFPTVMPYAGIGWGHKPTGKGFGLVADLGVAYGRPRVDFAVSQAVSGLAGAALSQEEDSVRNSIERYKWYPILQVGVSYRF